MKLLFSWNILLSVCVYLEDFYVICVIKLFIAWYLGKWSCDGNGKALVDSGLGGL